MKLAFSGLNRMRKNAKEEARSVRARPGYRGTLWVGLGRRCAKSFGLEPLRECWLRDEDLLRDSLNVEIAHVQRIVLDELAALFHIFAH